MKQILKVLVGSHAYGLARETSDMDYRGVFITPTSELLKIQSPHSNRVEGDGDDVNYEVGHFLNLALKSNPSVLELFVAPLVGDVLVEGIELRGLFPHVWSSRGVLDAFQGYSQSQQKRMLLEEDYNRKWKFAVAYIRVLLQAESLLTYGELPIAIPLFAYNDLKDVRDGHWTVGNVMDWVADLKEGVFAAYKNNPDKHSNPEPVNEFLLALRKENW